MKKNLILPLLLMAQLTFAGNSFMIRPMIKENYQKFVIYFEKSSYVEKITREYTIYSDEHYCLKRNVTGDCNVKHKISKSDLKTILYFGLGEVRSKNNSEITLNRLNDQASKSSVKVFLNLKVPFFRPFLCNLRVNNLGEVQKPRFESLRSLKKKSLPNWVDQDWFAENQSKIKKHDIFIDEQSKIGCSAMYPSAVYQDEINKEKNVAFVGLDFSLKNIFKNDELNAKATKFAYHAVPFILSAGLGGLVAKGTSIYLKSTALSATQKVIIPFVTGFEATALSYFTVENKMDAWLNDVKEHYSDYPSEYPGPEQTIPELLSALENKKNKTAWYSSKDKIKLSQFTDLGVLTGLNNFDDHEHHSRKALGSFWLKEDENIIKLFFRIKNYFPKNHPYKEYILRNGLAKNNLKHIYFKTNDLGYINKRQWEGSSNFNMNPFHNHKWIKKVKKP